MTEAYTDGRRKWSEEQRAELGVLLASGLSYGGAAKVLHVTKNAVTRQAQKLGITRASPIKPRRVRTARIQRGSTLPLLPSLAN